jgi:hypothetical protein
MRNRGHCFRAVLLAAGLVASASLHAAEPRKTRNVILVVTDGLRWQEVFRGAEGELLNKEHGGVADVAAMKRDFWRETPEERRAALMPFFWSVMQREGRIYGNKDRGGRAAVTNGLKFSYPGYNEMLTGAADPRIDKNDYGPNPNVTVFEWLNGLSAFAGRAAAFGSWENYGAIFNRERAKFPVQAGWEPLPHAKPTAAQRILADLYAQTTRFFSDTAFDALTNASAEDFVLSSHPRVLFIGYLETDEWAHEGRYDLVLRAARRVDGFLARLWATFQKMPEYRGRTTLLVTTDHGRGDGLEDWKRHAKGVAGAENIWLAALGPDTPASGEVTDEEITQSQIAATVAALLGEDYVKAVPAAAPPIAGIFGKPR